MRYVSKAKLSIISALSWLGGKSFDERSDGVVNDADSNVVVAAASVTPETQASTIVNTTYQPMRKYSTYIKNNTKIPKGAR